MRSLGDTRGESNNLGTLGNRCIDIGQVRRAIEYHEQAVRIARESDNREGQAIHLDNLGDSYRKLGRSDDALRCHQEALATAREIGYRLIEAAACTHIAELHISQGNWNEAATRLEETIEITEAIGATASFKEAKTLYVLVNVYRNDLAKAREAAEAAHKYSCTLINHAASAMLGVVALRQGDVDAARQAFTAAVAEASAMITLTGDFYAALDVKGLSLCGLALCGDHAQVPHARDAYRAARAVTSEAGITRDVLVRFDALAQADTAGMLAGVRPVAAGTS